jgi:hypothetical protein
MTTGTRDQKTSPGNDDIQSIDESIELIKKFN